MKRLGEGGHRQHGDHGPTVLDDGEGHRPLGASGDEGAGAIDRIDDKDAASAEALGRIGGLLGKPAIVGAGGAKDIGEEPVDGHVGFADDRIAVFHPGALIAAEKAERQCPGRQGRRGQKGEIGGAVRRHSVSGPRSSCPRRRRSAH